MLVRGTACALVLLLAASAAAQAQRETISIARTHKGKPVTIKGDLMLPAGTAKVPAMLVHHGSGGISDGRERRYAREFVKLGVAALVLDFFTGRGVTSTVSNQSAVTNTDMLEDAFAALGRLSQHARIDAARIGIVGFSKGGSVALLAAHKLRADRILPDGPRFALHVPVYPSCSTHHYKPKTTGAPIYLLLASADTYAGVAPCQEYAGVLKAEGANIETTVYPGARHGFDGGAAYTVATGENYSRCVFNEQPDGTWKERMSGLVTHAAGGRVVEANFKRALAKCRTFGVSGGPDAAAKAKALAALKGYVQRHLIERN